MRICVQNVTKIHGAWIPFVYICCSRYPSIMKDICMLIYAVSFGLHMYRCHINAWILLKQIPVLQMNGIMIFNPRS